MLRAFSFALTLILPGPALTTADLSNRAVLAQQSSPPQQMPRRDCEKNSDGIS